MHLYIYISILILLIIIITAIIAAVSGGEKSVINGDVRDNAPGNFIKLSDGYTHYDISGRADNPVVLFIHGFSVPYYMWDKTFHSITEAGYKTIRYDTYGRGLSDRPYAEYNEELFVRQIIELLDSLGINDKISIIGTSMGGAVTAAFAAAYPEKISRLILIDPVYTAHHIGLQRIPFIGELIAYHFKIPRFPERQMTDFYRPENFPEWPGRYREQMKYKGFRRAILSTCRNFLSKDPHPHYELLKKHNKKILLIWGKDDKVTPVDGAVKLCSLLSPELLLLDETGHLPHYERPEIVNPAIINFLGGIRLY